MTQYWVNNKEQANGDNEVHTNDCQYLPTSKKDLGKHSTCKSAVDEAKKTYKKANGCKYCCNACHTK